MRKVLSALILITVAFSLLAGGTFAHFVDTETSEENVFELGSLDLLVNGRNDLRLADDGVTVLWGEGVGPVSQIDDGQICTYYPFTVSVQNTGSSIDGDAYLLIKITDDSSGLAQYMEVSISHENVVLHADLLSNLASQALSLGPLDSGEYKEFEVELHPTGGPNMAYLAYDLEFILMQRDDGVGIPWTGGCDGADVDTVYATKGFVDTEESEGNYLQLWFGEGCTPGFWGGGCSRSGANWGTTLWDEDHDSDWQAAGGEGINPFIHTTMFNDFFFCPHGELDGVTMMDLVECGGGSNWVRKAARDVVAAYLNTCFGMAYPYGQFEIHDLWCRAVIGGEDGLTFEELHELLGPYNELGCPISKPAKPPKPPK